MAWGGGCNLKRARGFVTRRGRKEGIGYSGVRLPKRRPKSGAMS